MSFGILARTIKRLLHRVISKTERTMGVVGDHMHFIVDTSLGAFVSFAFFAKFAKHRQSLPPDAYHLARILATQSVDCGTCVQANVNFALRDGLSPAWITAALTHHPEALPPELRDVYQFTTHVLQHTYQEDELRETLRQRYGDRALIDLAYGIASAQVFPLTKQVLGFAKSCSKVEVKVEGAQRAAA